MNTLIKTKRRSRSLAQRGNLREFLYLRDKGRCGICGDPVKIYSSKVQLDHIVPLSHGGSEETDNLQLAHAYCNQRKGSRTTQPNTTNQ
jgi:5-methylcytosine-specific restriction endonuclease McrA